MMTTLDFDFFIRRNPKTVLENTKKTMRKTCGKRLNAMRELEVAPITVNDGSRFLNIVEQTTRISRHFELFQMLQGEDIQRFLPHQVMISAWGDLNVSMSNLDVISPLPGMRTRQIDRNAIGNLVKDTHKRWIAHGRKPLMLDSAMNPKIPMPAEGSPLHGCLQGNWSLLVHGVVDVRDGSESLYIALNSDTAANRDDADHDHPMLDQLITQIDVAFRRVAALKIAGARAGATTTIGSSLLSTREEEILLWLSEGKTNVEIAAILSISSFTVKNHMQRIMKKLNASNRTEAVAKYRQAGHQPQSRIPRKDMARPGVAPLHA